MSNGDPEETLLRVELDLVALEVVEGFTKIVDQCFPSRVLTMMSSM